MKKIPFGKVVDAFNIIDKYFNLNDGEYLSFESINKDCDKYEFILSILDADGTIKRFLIDEGTPRPVLIKYVEHDYNYKFNE